MSDAETYRLFIAIPIPEAVKAELLCVQRELRDALPPHSTSWTKPDNMHLTLRFLGDVAASRVPELVQAIRNAASGCGEIELHCERLGCFPDLRFPRVVWAWVHDLEGKLDALAIRVNEAVAAFAEKPADARFTGHITLARPKQIRRADAERLAQFVERAVNRQFGNWRATELELIRSELSSAGSCYTTLASVNLRQPVSQNG